MNQPERQWSSSRTQFATIVLVIIGLYLIATVIGRAINILDLKRSQANLVARQSDLAQTIVTLRSDIEYLQSESYIEQAARSTLLWGRPGEKLIVPLGAPSQSNPAATPTRRP